MSRDGETHLPAGNILNYIMPRLNPSNAENLFYTSDSDIYKRQNLTSKVDPRTERVKYL